MGQKENFRKREPTSYFIFEKMSHQVVQFDSRQKRYIYIYIFFFNVEMQYCKKKRVCRLITEEMEKMCPPFSSLRVGYLFSTRTFLFQVTCINQMTASSYCMYKTIFLSLLLNTSVNPAYPR